MATMMNTKKNITYPRNPRKQTFFRKQTFLEFVPGFIFFTFLFLLIEFVIVKVLLVVL